MRPIGFYMRKSMTKRMHLTVRSFKDTTHNWICFLAIISNNTSADLVAGATATHVLLAFHMLFINLLLLNLLIAVFTYVNWMEKTLGSRRHNVCI